MSLTDALDALKNSMELEAALRQATAVEWGTGLRGGPMEKAHEASIAQAVADARRLVELAGKS